MVEIISLTTLIIASTFWADVTYGFLVDIKGRVTCEGVWNFSGYKVKLLQKRSGTHSHTMRSEMMDNEGTFHIMGYTDNSNGEKDVRLRIYHKCNAGLERGEIKRDYSVPFKFFDDGAKDIGTISLDLAILRAETQDVIH